MTTRDHAPVGAPCWADLWTSDVEGSRRFYGELFGWKANDPDPAYGGYFIFDRDGAPVAGAMGDMGELRADNRWKVFLATDDIDKALAAAEAEGANVLFPAMAVGELGKQAVLVDPTGARLGAWQPGAFHGFSVLEEPGAPAWFELHTRDYARAIAFYRSVFGWETETMTDTPELRYTVLRNPEGEGHMAGIMDAASVLPDGAPSPVVHVLAGRGRRRRDSDRRAARRQPRAGRRRDAVRTSRDRRRPGRGVVQADAASVRVI